MGFKALYGWAIVLRIIGFDYPFESMSACMKCV
jgi:hypothetical protein